MIKTNSLIITAEQARAITADPVELAVEYICKEISYRASLAFAHAFVVEPNDKNLHPLINKLLELGYEVSADFDTYGSEQAALTISWGK